MSITLWSLKFHMDIFIEANLTDNKRSKICHVYSGPHVFIHNRFLAHEPATSSSPWTGNNHSVTNGQGWMEGE